MGTGVNFLLVNMTQVRVHYLQKCFFCTFCITSSIAECLAVALQSIYNVKPFRGLCDFTKGQMTFNLFL